MRILHRFLAAGLALVLLASALTAVLLPRVKREINERRAPVSAQRGVVKTPVLSAPVLGGEYDSSKKPAMPKYSEAT